MKKIIILIAVLMGLPLTSMGQRADDMYFFSSPKKEEKKANKQQLVPKRQATQKSVFIPNEGNAVIILDDKDRDLSAIDLYNRRGQQSVLENAVEDKYTVPYSDGKWINDGFNGSVNDFYEAERSIRSRNPRYTISVNSPYYWDAVYGLNSYDWNIYVDNHYAYVFPRFTNPAWGRWRFGSRYGFSLSVGYNLWGRPWYYGGYYDPWYYDSWYGHGYGYGGYYGGYYGHGYYDPWYHGGYYGYGHGGYYYSDRRRAYRDNRRYNGTSSWANSGRNNSSSYNRRDSYRRAGSSYGENGSLNVDRRRVNSGSSYGNSSRYNGTYRPSTRPTVPRRVSGDSNTSSRRGRYTSVHDTGSRGGYTVIRRDVYKNNSSNSSNRRYTRPSSTRVNRENSSSYRRQSSSSNRKSSSYNNSSSNRRYSGSSSYSSGSSSRSSGSSYRSGGSSSRSRSRGGNSSGSIRRR